MRLQRRSLCLKSLILTIFLLSIPMGTLPGRSQERLDGAPSSSENLTVPSLKVIDEPAPISAREWNQRFSPPPAPSGRIESRPATPPQSSSDEHLPSAAELGLHVLYHPSSLSALDDNLTIADSTRRPIVSRGDDGVYYALVTHVDTTFIDPRPYLQVYKNTGDPIQNPWTFVLEIHSDSSYISGADIEIVTSNNRGHIIFMLDQQAILSSFWWQLSNVAVNGMVTVAAGYQLGYCSLTSDKVAFSGPSVYLYACWTNYGRLYSKRSTDSGLSWTDGATVTSAASFIYMGNANAYCPGDNRVYILYTDTVGRVLAAMSSPAGLGPWTLTYVMVHPTVNFRSGGIASMVGNQILATAEGLESGGTDDIYFCSHGEGGWSTEVRRFLMPGNQSLPSCVANANGYYCITYKDQGPNFEIGALRNHYSTLASTWAYGTLLAGAGEVGSACLDNGIYPNFGGTTSAISASVSSSYFGWANYKILDTSPDSLVFTWYQSQLFVPPQSFTISNLGYGTMNWNVAENLNWLDVSPDSGTATHNQAAYPVCAITSLTFPGVGTYRGDIIVNAPGAQDNPDTVHVTLNCLPDQPILSTTPNNLTFNWYQGQLFVPPQSFTITNTGYLSMNWSVSENLSWLDVSPSSGGPLTHNQSSYPVCSILPAWPGVGTYTGDVIVNAPGAVGTPDTVHVTLNCLPPTPELSVTPDTITFTWNQGQPPPNPQNITITNSGYGNMTWTAAEALSWLSVNPISGGPLTHGQSSTASCFINMASWPGTGVWAGNVIISSPGALSSPDTVHIVMNCVVPPPTLSVTPDSLIFTWNEGQSPPPSQSILIMNTGYGSLSWSAYDTMAWVGVTPSSGGPLQHNMQNTAACAILGGWPGAGTYTGNIIFTAAGAQGSPDTVRVVLHCLSNTTPILSVTPDSLVFNWVEGGPQPAIQNFTVTNLGYGSMPVYVSDNATWLNTPTSLGYLSHLQTAPLSCMVVSWLGVGTYYAEVVVTAPGAVNSPDTVKVVLHCTSTLPHLFTTPNYLEYWWNQGDPAPTPQYFTISNTGYGPMPWNATENQTWLSLSPASGTLLPGESVAVFCTVGPTWPGGLHQANVTINAPGAVGTPDSVLVTLQCASVPVQTVSTTELNFFWTQGSAAPSNQTFTVTNTGYGTLNWSCFENIPWLLLNPVAGPPQYHNQSVTVTASITSSFPGLGTYSDQLVLFDVYAQGSPDTIRVNLYCIPSSQAGLTVTPPTLTFNWSQGMSPPAAQTITVKNAAQGTLSWTGSETSPWLNLNPTSGGPLGPGGTSLTSCSLTGVWPGVGVHTEYLIFTATGAANSPDTVRVTINCLAGTTPILSATPDSLNFTWNQGAPLPSPALVTVSNLGGGPIYSWSVSTNSTWMNISNVTPGTLNPGQSTTATVTIVNSWPGLGTYEGFVVVTAPGVAGSPDSVRVILHCNPSQAVLAVEPDSLTYTWLEGQPPPAGQWMSVANYGYASMTWFASPTALWMNLAPNAGGPLLYGESDSFQCTIVGPWPGSGLHLAYAIVTAVGAQNSPDSVLIKLNCVGGPQLSVSPDILTYTWMQGSAPPASQNLTVANTGYQTLNWTASEALTWLQITPGSGGPLEHGQSSTVACNITGSLPGVGTYTGHLIVTAPGAQGSPDTTLVVLNCLEGASELTTFPSTLVFNYYLALPQTPAPQYFTLINTGFGAMSWTASEAIPWLSLSPGSGSGLGHNQGASVTCTLGNPPGSGTYTGDIIVTAAGAQSSPDTVHVIFHGVLSAPAASITLTPTPPLILIPAGGGSFNYELGVRNNNTSIPISFQTWVMQQIPSGLWQGPLLGPISLTLPGGANVIRPRVQNVPGAAAAGGYTYRGYLGTYPGVKWDSSSIYYYKLDGTLTAGWDGGAINSSGNKIVVTEAESSGSGTNELEGWECYGEPFPSEYLTEALPTEFALGPVYPNPFNPVAAISYQLSAFSQASVRVYDTSGRLVKTLVDGWQAAGYYEVRFDGAGLASGLYLVRMQAGDYTAIKKLVLLK